MRRHVRKSQDDTTDGNFWMDGSTGVRWIQWSIPPWSLVTIILVTICVTIRLLTRLKTTVSVQQGIFSESATLKTLSRLGLYQLLGSPQPYWRVLYVFLTGPTGGGNMLELDTLNPLNLADFYSYSVKRNWDELKITENDWLCCLIVCPKK